jgi:hypothetical protein
MIKLNQEKFLKAILCNDNDEDFLKKIIPAKTSNKQKILDLYRDDYSARLTEALGEYYESIWMVLGDAEFFKLCKSYISSQNSLHYDLGQYGHSFVNFLNKQTCINDYPFLTELAILEQEYMRIFHLKNLKQKNIEFDLSNPNILEFTFSKNISLFNSNYPIYQIWKMKDENISQEVDWDSKDIFVLYKSFKGIMYYSLTIGQFHILEHLMKGGNLGDAIAKSNEYNCDINEIQVLELFTFLQSNSLLLKA